MFTFFSTELRIDEEDVGQRETDSSSGPFSSSLFLGKDNFKGCITNLYLRRSLFVTFIESIISALESLPTCLNFHIKYIYIISGFIPVKMYYVSALTCLCVCVCVCRPDSLYRAEDLSTYSSTGDVMFSTCSASQNM